MKLHTLLAALGAAAVAALPALSSSPPTPAFDPLFADLAGRTGRVGAGAAVNAPVAACYSMLLRSRCQRCYSEGD